MMKSIQAWKQIKGNYLDSTVKRFVSLFLLDLAFSELTIVVHYMGCIYASRRSQISVCRPGPRCSVKRRSAKQAR